jgi:hypothetical protein
MELGLALEERGGELRFFDPAAGKYLPTQQEAREAAEAARNAAEAGREAAEAKAERLAQELESLRRQLRGG